MARVNLEKPTHLCLYLAIFPSLSLSDTKACKDRYEDVF